MRKDVRTLLRDNAVTVMFVVLCVVSFFFSGQSLGYVAYELLGRLSRNAFIVLALIIPIIAGMGINFAITIGAMAAQIAALWVTEWQIPGLGGFAVAALMTIPIAALFGFLIGKLLNRMKGQEMIGGLILGYFANGLYQLLFLFIFGNLIPLHTDGLVIMGSTGVANTIDLHRIASSLDGLWRLNFNTAFYVCMAAAIVYCIVRMALKKVSAKKGGIALGVLVAVLALYQIPAIKSGFSSLNIPVVTFAVIGLLCLANVAIMRTRLGQQFRAVGQNMTVANAAGINVDRARVIAIMISTVLAGLGQLIYRAELRPVPDLRRARAGRPVCRRGDPRRRRVHRPRDERAGAAGLHPVPHAVHRRAAGRHEPVRRRGHRRILPRVHLLRRHRAGAGAPRMARTFGQAGSSRAL